MPRHLAILAELRRIPARCAALGIALLAAACAAPEAPFGPEAAVPHAGPPTAGVELSASSWSNGTSFVAAVSGVTPGEQVRFAVGGRAVASPCPALLGGRCLGLSRPSLLGTAIADAQGVARLVVTAPRRRLGTTVCVQAAVPRGAGGVVSVVSSRECRVVVKPPQADGLCGPPSGCPADLCDAGACLVAWGDRLVTADVESDGSDGWAITQVCEGAEPDGPMDSALLCDTSGVFRDTGSAEPPDQHPGMRWIDPETGTWRTVVRLPPVSGPIYAPWTSVSYTLQPQGNLVWTTWPTRSLTTISVGRHIAHRNEGLSVLHRPTGQIALDIASGPQGSLRGFVRDGRAFMHLFTSLDVFDLTQRPPVDLGYVGALLFPLDLAGDRLLLGNPYALRFDTHLPLQLQQLDVATGTLTTLADRPEGYLFARWQGTDAIAVDADHQVWRFTPGGSVLGRAVAQLPIPVNATIDEFDIRGRTLTWIAPRNHSGRARYATFGEVDLTTGATRELGSVQAPPNSRTRAGAGSVRRAVDITTTPAWIIAGSGNRIVVRPR